MTHGLMFHYFHNEDIRQTQGSISDRRFEDILDEYAKDYNVLPAREYMDRILKGTIGENDICITFDDGLYNQYKIAEPILDRKGITAFYFIYTSPMEGKLEKIEVYRAFRNSYKDISSFYLDFFETVVQYGERQGIDYKSVLSSDDAKDYHSQYTYYSENDRIFRYFRDIVIKDEYDEVMAFMMRRKDFDPYERCRDIWISSQDLRKMHDRGNIIGLHSHTHPTTIENMSYDEKYVEYSTNKRFLESAIGG